MFLAAYCPLCDGVVVEVLDIAGAEVRGRCRNRRCKDKPRLRWRVSAVGTVETMSMDADRNAPESALNAGARASSGAIAPSGALAAS